MSVTIVNDYFFKPDGNVKEGKAAAAELVGYFKAEIPEVELSLWLASQENPLHHYHITVFSTGDVIQDVRESAAIKRFVDRPHSLSLHVWPGLGGRLQKLLISCRSLQSGCGSFEPQRCLFRRCIQSTAGNSRRVQEAHGLGLPLGLVIRK